MTTVRTESQLKAAIRSNEPSIRIVGPMAQKYIRSKKARKAAKGGAVAGILASTVMLAAAPLTGGASAVPGIMGITAATGLTVGTVTISAAELAIICSFALAALAISKGYKHITVNADGSVTLEKE